MADIESNLEQQQQVLIANRDFIIKHLEADDVMDELIKARIIGQKAAQRIDSWIVFVPRVEKNWIIIDQLYTAGPGALVRFCDILKKKGRQTFIAEKLEKCMWG